MSAYELIVKAFAITYLDQLRIDKDEDIQDIVKDDILNVLKQFQQDLIAEIAITHNIVD